jgi:heptosyltransferase-3
MRILFITATRLGDAVLSTGLLDYLLATYPQARFTVACGPVASGLFARMPRLERVLVVEKKPLDLHWLGLWRALAGRRWDLAIDLRGSALTYALRAKRRVIMRGGRRPGHRLTHLAGALGLAEPRLPVVWMSAQDRADALAALPAGPAYIGLGPTANWRGKIWPPDRFAELFRALSALMPDAVPVIFGGSGTQEREMAAPVLADLPTAIDLVGQLDLPQVAACLRRCTLFVGNDSGLMHLAAASGTATLGVFGPSRADEYAPSGPHAAFAVADGPPGHGSMSDLSVAAVLREAVALIERVTLKLPA